ncbi:hypothetical protein ANANG_G00171180, partial [Anguilla anguilla]
MLICTYLKFRHRSNQFSKTEHTCSTNQTSRKRGTAFNHCAQASLKYIQAMHREGTQHSMSDCMQPSQRHICTVMGTVGSPLLQRFQTAVAHWNIQRHPRHSGAGSFWIFI